MLIYWRVYRYGDPGVVQFGSLEAYMQLHPTLHLSLHEYSETRVEQAGLVTLDAKLDLKRPMDAVTSWLVLDRSGFGTIV